MVSLIVLLGPVVVGSGALLQTLGDVIHTKGVLVSTDVQLRSKTPTAGAARPAQWSTVFPAGEIDVASAPALVTDLLAASPEGVGIAVDFTNVEFIDASGVNALIEACNHQRLLGGDLVVRSPSAQLRWMLELFGLRELLERPGDERDSHPAC
jgi:anti-sigma B factor antagonist